MKKNSYIKAIEKLLDLGLVMVSAHHQPNRGPCLLHAVLIKINFILKSLLKTESEANIALHYSMTSPNLCWDF